MPLILRVVPSDYLPILLGDYLALHFGVYGLLTMLGIWFTPRRQGADGAPAGFPLEPGRVLWSAPWPRPPT